METDLCRIRSYEPKDEEGYIALMNTVFPNYKCDLIRWRWEYKENPFGFLQVFGTFNGKTIGHMGLIGVPIMVNGTIVRGSQAVDLAVHPDFRGKGMFIGIGEKLVQQAEREGFVLSYGMPNEPAYHGHLKYGWFSVSEIPVLTRITSRKAFALFIATKFHDLFSHPNSASISRILTLVRDLIRAKNAGILGSERQESYTTHVVKSFGKQFNELWKEASIHHQLLVVRNEEYLNWRYAKRPYSNYLILAIEKSNRVEGYVVLATEIQRFAKWKKGYIVDIFSKSDEGTRFLISLACNYFAKTNIDAIICWMMKKQPYYDSLVEYGFVNDTFSSQRFICRINAKNSVFMKLRHKLGGNWFLTIGDSDRV